MKIHKNIFLESERKQMLSLVKNKIKNLGDNFPGLQTPADLHKNTQAKTFYNKIKKYHKGYKVHKSWGLCSNGDLICWHKHTYPVVKSIVYILNSKNSMGPIFLEERKQSNWDKIKVTNCPQNSLIIFDSRLLHSTPCHLKEKRYSIAIDLID